MPSATSNLSDLSEKLLLQTRQLLVLDQQLQLARRPAVRNLLDRIYAARILKEKEWWTAFMSLSSDLFGRFRAEIAYQTASHLRDKGQIARSLELGTSRTVWTNGGVAVYLQLALETSEVAGQLTLEQLGLNRTFAWAHPRAMAQDLFAVRGSKVIQNLYGYHLDKLTDIIFNATNPAAPLTLAEVEAAIAEEWPQLTRSKVTQIARTETAAVWTQTQVNAMRANGVERYRSIVASGPAIGVQQANPCPVCVEAAAVFHPVSGASFDLPPWHPSCRCVAVPELINEDGSHWLPPDEPWVGAPDDALVALEDF